MGIDWIPGVEITVQAALSATVAGSGVWDAAVWDTATWGPDEIWTDISPWVRSVQIDRRFAQHLQVWESGTATIELNNPGGRFSATNLAGPYVAAGRSMIRTLRPVRVLARLIATGTTYPMYRGVSGAWTERWIGPDTSVVSVPCDDVWSLLATDGIPGLAASGAGESYGQRLHRILTAAGYTGARTISVGQNTMQATDLSARPVDELVLTAKSEGGAVWVDADGAIVGEDQLALVEQARSVDVQAVFGDGTGPPAVEVPYRDVVLGWRSDLVRNVVSYARDNGAVRTWVDNDARAMTGVDLRASETGLVCQTDDQVDRLASWYLAQYKTDEQTVKQLTLRWLNPVHGPRIIEQAVTRRIRDLVEVRRRPPAGDEITRFCHIAGIHHTIDSEPTTTFDLWSAAALRQFAGSRWDHERALWGSDEADPDAARWFY